MNKKDKARIISIVLQKGGVGKSQSCLNLGSALAAMGVRTLMVDLDPQSSLTVLLNIEAQTLDYTIADVLLSFSKKERVGIEKCILNVGENLDLCPSIIDLSIADLALAGVYSREFILSKALAPIVTDYDCILIDCQPSLSLLPINALAASTDVIIPCQTEYLAYRGLGLLEETLAGVKENMNENIDVYGIIATKFEHTLHHREVLELLEKNYNVLGVIPKSIQVSDAGYQGSGAVVDVAPNSKPAIAYKQIAEKMYHDFGFDKKVANRVKGDEM